MRTAYIIITLTVLFCSCRFSNKEKTIEYNSEKTESKYQNSITNDTLIKPNREASASNNLCSQFYSPINFIKRSLKEYTIYIESFCSNNYMEMFDHKNLVNIIPRNEEEYTVFYMLSEESVTKTCFQRLLKAIYLHIDDCGSAYFYSVLRMANFVDGYIAEDYFYEMEYFIEKRKMEFCRLYATNEMTLLKFKDESTSYCL